MSTDREWDRAAEKRSKQNRKFALGQSVGRLADMASGYLITQDRDKKNFQRQEELLKQKHQMALEQDQAGKITLGQLFPGAFGQPAQVAPQLAQGPMPTAPGLPQDGRMPGAMIPMEGQSGVAPMPAAPQAQQPAAGSNLITELFGQMDPNVPIDSSTLYSLTSLVDRDLSSRRALELENQRFEQQWELVRGRGEQERETARALHELKLKEIEALGRNRLEIQDKKNEQVLLRAERARKGDPNALSPSERRSFLTNFYRNEQQVPDMLMPALAAEAEALFETGSYSMAGAAAEATNGLYKILYGNETAGGTPISISIRQGENPQYRTGHDFALRDGVLLRRQKPGTDDNKWVRMTGPEAERALQSIIDAEFYSRMSLTQQPLAQTVAPYLQP
jgi:hypothetical protein